MHCPACGHRILNQGERCLYCGATIRGGVCPESGLESPPLLIPPGNHGKNSLQSRADGGKIDSRKLQDLPLSLRVRVEEILGKEEGGHGEMKKSLRDFLEPAERTDREKKRMGFRAALRILLKKD